MRSSMKKLKTLGLDGPSGYLYITRERKKEEEEYLDTNYETTRPNLAQRSVVLFTMEAPR